MKRVPLKNGRRPASQLQALKTLRDPFAFGRTVPAVTATNWLAGVTTVYVAKAPAYIESITSGAETLLETTLSGAPNSKDVNSSAPAVNGFPARRRSNEKPQNSLVLRAFGHLWLDSAILRLRDRPLWVPGTSSRNERHSPTPPTDASSRHRTSSSYHELLLPSPHE